MLTPDALDTLTGIGIFSRCERATLAAAFVSLKVPAACILALEDEPAQYVFVVQRGLLSVRTYVSRSVYATELIAAGEVAGEERLFGRPRYLGTIRTLRDSEALVGDAAFLRAQASAGFAFDIAAAAYRRLESARNATLTRFYR